MLKVMGDIEWAAGEGKCTILLALDISAAFDAVDHFMLCRDARNVISEYVALHCVGGSLLSLIDRSTL